ncbi:hypothetical protein Pelo_7032 [Pelomyxa schiedti]|nr:hypothetical protein Pelo_7032 [Pelomyxa schiedti]
MTTNNVFFKVIWGSIHPPTFSADRKASFKTFRSILIERAALHLIPALRDMNITTAHDLDHPAAQEVIYDTFTSKIKTILSMHQPFIGSKYIKFVKPERCLICLHKHIMQQMNLTHTFPISPDPYTQKLSQLFDLVGGVGTGGIAALALGSDIVDIGELVKFFTVDFPRFYTKSYQVVKFVRMYFENIYDRTGLDTALQNMFGDSLMHDMHEKHPDACKVFVAARQGGQPVLFTSYHVFIPSEKIGIVKEHKEAALIRGAAGATSATYYYFDPVEIEKNTYYYDGSDTIINPSDVHCVRFNLYLTSLGGPNPETVHSSLVAKPVQSPYYRLNPPLSSDCAPDDAMKVDALVAATKEYITKFPQFKEMCLNLLATSLYVECNMDSDVIIPLFPGDKGHLQVGTFTWEVDVGRFQVNVSVIDEASSEPTIISPPGEWPTGEPPQSPTCWPAAKFPVSGSLIVIETATPGNPLSKPAFKIALEEVRVCHIKIRSAIDNSLDTPNSDLVCQCPKPPPDMNKRLSQLGLKILAESPAPSLNSPALSLGTVFALCAWSNPDFGFFAARRALEWLHKNVDFSHKWTTAKEVPPLYMLTGLCHMRTEGLALYLGAAHCAWSNRNFGMYAVRRAHEWLLNNFHFEHFGQQHWSTPSAVPPLYMLAGLCHVWNFHIVLVSYCNVPYIFDLEPPSQPNGCVSGTRSSC